MNLCASCSLQLTGDAGLCPHHHLTNGDDWAKGNKIWSDFFHRGIVPKRLTLTDRDDELRYTGDVA